MSLRRTKCKSIISEIRVYDKFTWLVHMDWKMNAISLKKVGKVSFLSYTSNGSTQISPNYVKYIHLPACHRASCEISPQNAHMDNGSLLSLFLAKVCLEALRRVRSNIMKHTTRRKIQKRLK